MAKLHIGMMKKLKFLSVISVKQNLSPNTSYSTIYEYTLERSHTSAKNVDRDLGFKVG